MHLTPSLFDDPPQPARPPELLEPGAMGVAPSQPGYPQGIALQSLQPPLPRPERPRWQPLA